MAVYDRATVAVLPEEQYEVSTARHAMAVYDRATVAVLPEEQYEFCRHVIVADSSTLYMYEHATMR